MQRDWFLLSGRLFGLFSFVDILRSIFNETWSLLKPQLNHLSIYPSIHLSILIIIFEVVEGLQEPVSDVTWKTSPNPIFFFIFLCHQISFCSHFDSHGLLRSLKCTCASPRHPSLKRWSGRGRAPGRRPGWWASFGSHPCRPPRLAKRATASSEPLGSHRAAVTLPPALPPAAGL